MNKPCLLADCDGVIAAYHHEMLDVLQRLGHDYVWGDITHFDHENWMSKKAHKDFERHVMNGVTGYDFYRQLDLLDGAYRLLPGGDVYKKFNIVYVTAANKTSSWLSARALWFKYLGVDVAREVIYCSTENKKMIRGDFMIDDNVEIIRSWSEINSSFGTNAVLVNYPWNQYKAPPDADPLHPGFTRAADVNDACDYLLGQV